MMYIVWGYLWSVGKLLMAMPTKKNPSLCTALPCSSVTSLWLVFGSQCWILSVAETLRSLTLNVICYQGNLGPVFVFLTIPIRILKMELVRNLRTLLLEYEREKQCRQALSLGHHRKRALEKRKTEFIL